MNTIELSEYLYAKGHRSILLSIGTDIEKLLLGYSRHPINIVELHRIAKLEGFVQLDNGIWVNSQAHINKIKQS